ncbi:hypothetical protein GOV04_05495 [Candidatus Woesearchaeota archaeon]|nr:hypothetical protein [Candidatus Woesearchaeota archaeon]
MIEEYIESAKEELKRVDHLVYVSLKYARTCDVLKSVVIRLIDAIDFLFDALAQKAKDENKIIDLPTTPALKADTLKKAYADDELIQEMITFYLFLRRVNRAEFTRKNEYRRHVTMTVILEDVIGIKIETVTDYYNKAREYVKHIEELLEND